MDTVRVKGLRDLLGMIPLQLGFTPTNSLVVISLRGPRHRVGLVGRIDLQGATSAAHALAAHLKGDGASAAIVVIYSDSPQPRSDADIATVLFTMGEALASVEIPVTEACHVGPERFVSLDCTDECCPPEGTPVDAIKDSVVVAEMTLRGFATVGKRADLLGDLTPADPDVLIATEAFAGAAAASPIDQPLALGAWRKAFGSAELTVDVAGLLLAAMDDLKLRDALMITMVPGVTDEPDRFIGGDERAGAPFASVFDARDPVRPDRDTVELARTTLLALVRCATGRRAVGPLCLLGWLAWWSGDGAQANDYIGMALKADPSHSLSRLMDMTLQAGIPPGWAQAFQVADALGVERRDF